MEYIKMIIIGMDIAATGEVVYLQDAQDEDRICHVTVDEYAGKKIKEFVAEPSLMRVSHGWLIDRVMKEQSWHLKEVRLMADTERTVFASLLWAKEQQITLQEISVGTGILMALKHGCSLHIGNELLNRVKLKVKKPKARISLVHEMKYDPAALKDIPNRELPIG